MAFFKIAYLTFKNKNMQTTVGKLRNVTTGILHTNIGDVYKFFEEYTGEEGIMTHHLPSAAKALEPILKRKLSDEWFTKEWIKEDLDKEATIEDLTQDERQEFFTSFGEYAANMWDKIKDKTVAVVI